MIAPAHPETKQNGVTHLSSFEGLCSEHITVCIHESNNQVLPGSDAIGVSNDTFGTSDRNANIICQKLCEKNKTNTNRTF